MIPTERETGRPRGFAFITYANEADAKDAIEGMNGKVSGFVHCLLIQNSINSVSIKSGRSGKNQGIHFIPWKVKEFREKSGNFREIKKSLFFRNST